VATGPHELAENTFQGANVDQRKGKSAGSFLLENMSSEKVTLSLSFWFLDRVVTYFRIVLWDFRKWPEPIVEA